MKEIATFKDKPVSSWSTARYHRKGHARLGKVLVLIIVCLVVYTSFRHTLTSDSDSPPPSTSGNKQLSPGRNSNRQPKLGGNNNLERIFAQLPNLRKSMVLAPSGKSAGSANKNILFIASSPSAASLLASCACEFANQGDAVVNFAIVGSPVMDIPSFLSINHINPYFSTNANSKQQKQQQQQQDDYCRLHFHDARAVDMLGSASSPDPALLANTLGLLAGVLDPIAVLWSPDAENDSVNAPPGTTRVDKFVQVGLKFFQANPRFNVLDLNLDMIKNLEWLPLLSVSALSRWPSFKLDIIIKISHHLGDTIRLLKSITNTNFLGLPSPRLIIEISDDLVDTHFPQFISSLNYPSEKIFVQIKPFDEPDLTLSSLYPVSNDRCLINLPPNYELSKYWFHWLAYGLLQFKDSGIAGVSLTPLQNAPENLPPNSPVFAQEAPPGGVAYYPEVWRQIYSFIIHKSHSHHNDINIPLQQQDNNNNLSHIDQALILQGDAIVYPPLHNGVFAFQHDDFAHGVQGGSESHIQGDLVRVDPLTINDLIGSSQFPVLDYTRQLMDSTSTDDQQHDDDDEEDVLEETREFHNFNSQDQGSSYIPPIREINRSIRRKLKISMTHLGNKSLEIRQLNVDPKCSNVLVDKSDIDPWGDVFCSAPSQVEEDVLV